MAERGLSALIRAVTELFGPEQAKLSAEDWLDESHGRPATGPGIPEDSQFSSWSA
jgi:hypothetical protein